MMLARPPTSLSRCSQPRVSSAFRNGGLLHRWTGLPLRQHAGPVRRLLSPSITAKLPDRPPGGGKYAGRAGPRGEPRYPQQPEQPLWRGLTTQMVDNMEITELEPYVRNMTAPREVRGVPMGLAAAVVERIAHTRLAEFQGCSAMLLSMLVWEVFLLFDRGKVTRGQALPAMRLLARVAAAMPIDRFLPIDVAQVTINLAKFGLKDTKWFARLAAGEASGLDWQGVRRAKGLEQSITNTIYGLALVNCSTATAFIDHMFAAAMTRLPDFKPQGCSNMLWAFAKLQHPLDSPELLAAAGHKDPASLVRTILETAVLPQLDQFTSQNVSNTLYALVVMKLPQDPYVMDALVGRMVVCLKFEDCDPQDAANCMWALGTGGYSAAALKLQQPLLNFLQAGAADFDPQAISNVAIALVKLGHHCPPMCSALVAAAKPRVNDFGIQALANLLWCLATLEPTAHCAFFQELQPLLLSRLGGFNKQDVANATWAYAVVLGEGTSKDLALGLCRTACNLSCAEIRLPQVFQLLAVCSTETQAAVAADKELHQFKQLCALEYGQALDAPQLTSYAAQLMGMQQAFRAEFHPHFTISFYGIDMRSNLFTFANGQQVVFDLMPPSRYSSHSTTPQQQKELGYVVLRRRMLAKAGWPDAVMLPMSEWEGLKSDEARLRYLRHRLSVK